jgi:hypothetical protein
MVDEVKRPGVAGERTEADGALAEGVDEWGVPDRFFGRRVPDDFAAALTRVTMLSSLVDAKLLGLISTLGADPQSTWAGRSTEQLVRELTQIAGAGAPARAAVPNRLLSALQLAVSAVRDDARMRNELVHATWPVPSLVTGVGWKPLPKAQRENEAVWSAGVGVNEEAIRALIGRLIVHVIEVDRLRESAEMFPRIS